MEGRKKKISGQPAMIRARSELPEVYLSCIKVTKNNK